jgi:hypothetical protein
MQPTKPPGATHHVGSASRAAAHQSDHLAVIVGGNLVGARKRDKRILSRIMTESSLDEITRASRTMDNGGSEVAPHP